MVRTPTPAIYIDELTIVKQEGKWRKTESREKK